MTAHPASASRAGVIVGVVISLLLHGIGGGALTVFAEAGPPPDEDEAPLDVALVDATPAAAELEEAEDAADADPEPKPTRKPEPPTPPSPTPPPPAPAADDDAPSTPTEPRPTPTSDDAPAASEVAPIPSTADDGLTVPARKPRPKPGTVPRRPKPAPTTPHTDDEIDPTAVKEVVNKEAVRNTTVDCNIPEPDIRVSPDDPQHWIVRKALIERYATSMKEFNSLGWSRPSPFEEAPGRQIGGFGCASPLYKAGMRARDVIQAINDKRMYTVAQVIGFWLFGKKKGDFTCTLYRRGQVITHTYTVLEDDAYDALPPLPPTAEAPTPPGSDASPVPAVAP